MANAYLEAKHVRQVSCVLNAPAAVGFADDSTWKT